MASERDVSTGCHALRRGWRVGAGVARGRREDSTRCTVCMPASSACRACCFRLACILRLKTVISVRTDAAADSPPQNLRRRARRCCHHGRRLVMLIQAPRSWPAPARRYNRHRIPAAGAECERGSPTDRAGYQTARYRPARGPTVPPVQPRFWLR